MTPDEAIQQARTRSLAPVYLVLGEESYLRDRVTAAVEQACLDGGLADFNVDKLSASDCDAARVLAAVRTVPMMAPRRFVLLRGVERWDGNESGVASLDAVAEYAKAPVPSTTLVLTAHKLDGRRKLVTLAKKEGFLVACPSLTPHELPRWIAAQAETKGHTVAGEVAALLAEISGPELGVLDDALERLSLYVGPGSAIDERAVAACVTRVRFADTWALVDALGRRDLGRALALLDEVYEPSDHGLPLVGAIAWSFRQMARLEAALAGGASLDAAAKAAAIFPTFRARDVEKKLRAFRPGELARALCVLEETDRDLKSSRRPGQAILEVMLTRLCRRAA